MVSPSDIPSPSDSSGSVEGAISTFFKPGDPWDPPGVGRMKVAMRTDRLLAAHREGRTVAWKGVGVS
jgi:hypothetical protein